ncbi:MAG: hypothetical protein GY884_22130 [Proteobacteria bacterium]|nr:hypothetical protein [Pseudomonadota bacterium]
MLLLLACAPEPAPTSGSFSALSYNVHGLPPEITGDDTAGRMELIAPRLGDFAVVGLQEDFDDDNHETLTAESGHAVNLRFNETFDDDRFYGSGLAVLLELELVDHHHEHYELCNGTLDGAGDCLASKGFQVAVLALGDSVVHIYNTHLEAGGGDEDDAARASHVDQLLAAMDGFSAGETVLFMGDTNLNDDDPEDLVEILRLKDYGLEDSCDLLGCPTPGRIDRFMVLSRGELVLTPTSWEVPADWQDADGVDLSDHEPIATTWDWDVLQTE